MKLRIEPSHLRGAVTAPPSKSMAHRLLICAALASGDSFLQGIPESQDLLATLDCISALGIPVLRDGNAVRISGGLRGFPAGTVFPCRESGSTLRFFLPVALAAGGSAVFTGSERLLQRGVGIYETLFREKGVRVEPGPAGISVSGQLAPGEYRVRGDVSSQFVSGLLFALPLLGGDSILRVLPPVESRPYIRLTLTALRRSGIRIDEPEQDVFRIPGGQRFIPQTAAAEGDWSNAAVLFALRQLGQELTVTGLDPDSMQGDRVCVRLLEQLNAPEPESDLSNCPDLGPILFAAAAALHGAVFTGTRRLRIKESDRAAAMQEELGKFGIRVRVEENRVTVLPGTLRRPVLPLSSHNDHRIIMALTLLCTLVGGSIDGAEAISKSNPAFFPALQKLGLQVFDETGTGASCP